MAKIKAPARSYNRLIEQSERKQWVEIRLVPKVDTDIVGRAMDGMEHFLSCGRDDNKSQIEIMVLYKVSDQTWS